MTPRAGDDPAPTSGSGQHYPPRGMWKARLTLAGGVFTKDYSQNCFPARWWGRLCLRWEEKALTRLAGVPGIPALLGRPTPYSLRLEAVPGVPLAALQPSAVTAEFLARLRELFAAIHARGVAHGDAHRRNILVHEERPYLIDFSTAYVRGRSPILDDYLFSCFCLLDEERIYKVAKGSPIGGTPPRMFLLYRILKGRRCRRKP